MYTMGDTPLGVKPGSRSKLASSQGEARSCLRLELESKLNEAHIEVSETREVRVRRRWISSPARGTDWVCRALGNPIPTAIASNQEVVIQ
ncbi:hypothetical protein L6452_01039 [Arctium lappa]|uniref:Uncharacterized protein n=1 Tax=Arctium lappa TaxID=4217 RepID=A0ACB9FGD7_ARCLA|nr:hypothetical protein L6452_01039 [Arctium lappa]